MMQLLDLGFVALGTLRANKKELPREFLPEKSKAAGTTVYGFHDEKVMLVSWTAKKNKTVLLLSTDPSSMPTVSEIDQVNENSENIISKPKVVSQYNVLKGGVDTLDKSTGYYSCKRRSNRHPVAIIYNIIDICSHNGFHLYMAAHPEFKSGEKSKKKYFLDELSKELALEHVMNRKKNYAMNQDVLQKVDGFINNFQTMYGKCWQCHTRQNLSKCEICTELCCPTHRCAVKLHTCPSCAKLEKVSYSKIEVTGRKRCLICPRKLDVKTTVSCNSCGTPYCSRHENSRHGSYEICTKCSEPGKDE